MNKKPPVVENKVHISKTFNALLSPHKIKLTQTFYNHKVQATSESSQHENDSFRTFLDRVDGNELDTIVHRLNVEITPSINCMECGNCCRSLMINVEEDEIDPVANHLQINAQQFKEKYLEISQQGHMVMNTIPCAFLHKNTCTVYESRFSECREFPHLHKANFKGRLFGTFMHYDRCPIIFSVIEQLKIELEFHPVA